MTISVSLGIYISVPFCRTKCSFCNFASGVFSPAQMQQYVDRVAADIALVPAVAAKHDAQIDRAADSIYLGGGTPSTLAPPQLEQLFRSVREQFDVRHDAEVTVECAPGTLTPELIATLLRCGVNRVSLGVQSFVDQESRAVGRLHTRAIVLDDIARLRDAGITELSLDLIAGLPHQTLESWERSLDGAIASGVPHISVYMLEVDEDSRLGRELLAGGQRYHAHHVPDADLQATMYERACERLEQASVRQYEISNFARAEHESRHNLKYWLRQPYFGFGVDAHSMLHRQAGALRLSTQDDLASYLRDTEWTATDVPVTVAVEEEFFLGLRLNRGVEPPVLAAKYGTAATATYHPVLTELVERGLLRQDGERFALTARGRLLSNEVFAEFLNSAVVQ
jgi:putative oxygen-independent coproporphyrinogen III oxidase